MLVGRALASSLYGVTPLDAASYAHRGGGSGVRCVGSERVAGTSRRKRGAIDSIAHGVAVPHSIGDNGGVARLQNSGVERRAGDYALVEIKEWSQKRVERVVRLSWNVCQPE